MQQYTHENVRSIPHLPIYCDRYEDYRQFSPRHWHDHIEIIYVVSGSLQVDCGDRKSTRLNSSHQPQSRMPSSA